MVYETGIYDYWIYLAGNSKDCGINRKMWMQKYVYFELNIIRFKGVFYLWLIGSFLSLAFFFFELKILCKVPRKIRVLILLLVNYNKIC